MSYPRQANQDEVLAGFIEPWIARGREDERAAIVAWLRGGDHEGLLETIADDIERGAHVRDDDE